MSDVLYWMADNLEVWRPAAVMALAVVALAALYYYTLAGDD